MKFKIGFDQNDKKKLFKYWDQIIQNHHSINQLNSRYCQWLYETEPNYQRIAQITKLDRRTVKKYIEENSEEK